MGRSAKLALAAVCLLLGLPLMAFALSRATGSPRSFIQSHYTRVSGAGSDAVYTSPRPPGRVADEISRAWKPAQRLTDPGGHFLRYSNLIVAITPYERGGSRIYVDDERRGYSRWYPYVRGWWGSDRGRVESVRGGGPGAGK